MVELTSPPNSQYLKNTSICGTILMENWKPAELVCNQCCKKDFLMTRWDGGGWGVGNKQWVGTWAPERRLKIPGADPRLGIKWVKPQLGIPVSREEISPLGR